MLQLHFVNLTLENSDMFSESTIFFNRLLGAGALAKRKLLWIAQIQHLS